MAKLTIALIFATVSTLVTSAVAAPTIVLPTELGTGDIIESLRKEFESIRTTLGKMDSTNPPSATSDLVIPGSVPNVLPNRGPVLDITEWLSTVTAIVRQLPFVQRVTDRLTSQINSVDQGLGLSATFSRSTNAQGDIKSHAVTLDVEQTRELVSDWLVTLQTMSERMGANTATWQGRVSQLPRKARQVGVEISDGGVREGGVTVTDLFSGGESGGDYRQGAAGLPFSPLGSWISNWIGVATTLRSSVTDTINVLSASYGRLVTPGQRLAKEFNHDAVNGQLIALIPAEATIIRSIIETLTTIRQQIDTLVDVYLKLSAKYLVQQNIQS